MDIGSFLTSISENTKVFSIKTLSNLSKEKLLSYQEKHVLKLLEILLNKKIAIDTSDTGIGKTYIAAAICRELERRPIIICPKTLIYNWKCILDFFEVKEYDIVNYETIKNGKTYADEKYNIRKKSKYIKSIDIDENKTIYNWNVPKDSIIILDEVHRCKHVNTNNGRLLMSFKELIKIDIPVLMLSATICEKYTDVKIPFYLFNFIENTKDFNKYIKILKNKYHSCRIKKRDYKEREDEYKIAKDNVQSMIIYEEIKEYTSRIKIKDLGDNFPKNQWCGQQFIAEETEKISEAYEEISKLMEALKNNPGKNHLARIQKLKQEIELRKVPIFIEQTQLYLEENKSVIIFVNYLDTLYILINELNIKCKIHGSQTIEERQNMINLFQSNEEKVIICQIRAGGVGIGLHDIGGNNPRAVLLNYPVSASDLLQALGRAPRSGAKSPVIQRIIFVANVDYEKKIMENINKKLRNISAINDGDLNGYNYEINK